METITMKKFRDQGTFSRKGFLDLPKAFDNSLIIEE